jgi:hypothetical protein
MGDLIGALVPLAIAVLMIVSLWMVFEKAGRPGWYAIIPIFNAIVMLKIAGKDWWWIILFFIPLVNLIATILVGLGMAEKFGKSQLFGIGLTFLGFIFYPILAFGDAEYVGD